MIWKQGCTKMRHLWYKKEHKCTYSGMLKSERPKSKQCWNPNNRSFEQTFLDFGSFGSFNCSDFSIHSIRMPKSERSNRIVLISDDIFCPKSEQIVRISALFSVRTKSSTEQRGSIRNPNIRYRENAKSRTNAGLVIRLSDFVHSGLFELVWTKKKLLS